MNRIKYLFDTNFILGILKTNPVMLADVSSRRAHTSECERSSITRMEFLGLPGITREEESNIRRKLSRLIYLPLTEIVEDVVINLRPTRKIKLRNVGITVSHPQNFNERPSEGFNATI